MSLGDDYAWNDWGNKLRSVRGLHLVAVLKPSGDVVVPLVAHEVSQDGVEDIFQVVADAFGALREQDPEAWMARWIYKKAILHACLLADLTTVIALSPNDKHFDQKRFEQIIEELKLAFESDAT